MIVFLSSNRIGGFNLVLTLRFLSAAGAHRWLKVDESCRKNTQPFLDQGFQKHKIFMNPDKQEDWMVKIIS